MKLKLGLIGQRQGACEAIINQKGINRRIRKLTWEETHSN